jgi:hypothetical protein
MFVTRESQSCGSRERERTSGRVCTGDAVEDAVEDALRSKRGTIASLQSKEKVIFPQLNYNNMRTGVFATAWLGPIVKAYPTWSNSYLCSFVQLARTAYRDSLNYIQHVSVPY